MTSAADSRSRASRARVPLLAFVVALVARLLVVAWGRDFPPAADGVYYDTLARRLADGQGYTWRWPDGAVTYAAHYPVGYPALVALGYRVFGAHPIVAMLENALLGAIAAAAVVVLARPAEPSAQGDRRALLAGIVFALHPALLPYTIALMTEGVAIALVTIAAALTQIGRKCEVGAGDATMGARDATMGARDAKIGAGDATARNAPATAARRARRFRIAAAVVLGASVLVRPQWLLLAPVLGALSIGGGARARARWAAAFTAIALACCAPWTIRNCTRMERCALVSVNGGWNLLIGTQTDNGSFATIEVPDECKTVWSEAGKDACFEHAARRAIAGDPVRFLAKVPKKLSVTFDYFGAAPWYLEASNPAKFPYRAKVVLGTVETVASRALLLVACVGWGVRGRRGMTRIAGLAASAFALSRWGAVSYLLLGTLLAARGRALLGRALLPALAVAVIAETCIMHAIFFGGGRYGLVVVPFTCALAFAQPGLADAADGAREERVNAAQAIAGEPRKG